MASPAASPPHTDDTAIKIFLCTRAAPPTVMPGHASPAGASASLSRLYQPRDASAFRCLVSPHARCRACLIAAHAMLSSSMNIFDGRSGAKRYFALFTPIAAGDDGAQIAAAKAARTAHRMPPALVSYFWRYRHDAYQRPFPLAYVRLTAQHHASIAEAALRALFCLPACL